jgi:hypothetical protein
MVQSVLARALAGLGRSDEAAATARAALAALERAGASEHHSLALVGAAEALEAAGRAAEAAAAFAQAKAWITTCAARIRDATLRASFLERVPEHVRTLARG